MKRIIMFLTLGILPVTAQPHDVKKYKVSIELPDSWQHNSEAAFGYEIKQADKPRGVRIHFQSANKSELIPAFNAMLQSFEWNATNHTKAGAPNRIIEILAVKDSQGKEGFRITSGLISGEKRHLKLLHPNVFHYLFINSDNKPVCVCLSTLSGITDSAEADLLILKTLRVD